MSGVLSALGVDVEDLGWQQFAICKAMPTNNFYDDYEANEEMARLVDDVCLSCPVRSQCLQAGVENGEDGVWGAVYLSAGKPDQKRNSHKTPDIWEAIREGIIDG